MPLNKPRNKAYLVVLKTRDRSSHYIQESYEEMKELVGSAGIQIVGVSTGTIDIPSPSHFVRDGKLNEIREEAKKVGANIFIFNVNLTPAQARNIEMFAKIPAMDRTGLILDIFGKRAKSSEGKLQVELAHLNYVLPRLGGLGRVMSRLGGGIGTRGPGEQELEWDRRKIRRRIQRVKEELKKVSKHRELIRSSRRRKKFTTVALVGYTNAGKSTLLNALTGAETYVKDKVFATLDPKTRLQTINGRSDILYIDTVGFLKDLPHTLVEAFHATLEEVSQADVLIHVLDVSHSRASDYKVAVEEVLEEIHASKIPTVLALNKADLLSEESKVHVQNQWPQGIFISAKLGHGLKSLLAKLNRSIDTPPAMTETSSIEQS